MDSTRMYQKAFDCMWQTTASLLSLIFCLSFFLLFLPSQLMKAMWWSNFQPGTRSAFGTFLYINTLWLQRHCLGCITLMLSFRSSPPELFLGRGVLKICRKFTGEHLYRSAISIKLLWNFCYFRSFQASSFWHKCESNPRYSRAYSYEPVTKTTLP